jgi:hypothetical protein
MAKEMLHSIFATSKLSTLGVNVVAEVRTNFDILLTLLENRLPPSRELSVVKTNLESACMYAIKAVSMEERFQDHEERP